MILKQEVLLHVHVTSLLISVESQFKYYLKEVYNNIWRYDEIIIRFNSSKYGFY